MDRTLIQKIIQYTGENGFAPSYRELAMALPGSISTVHAAVARLVKNGYLTGSPRLSRTLRVTTSGLSLLEGQDGQL